MTIQTSLAALADLLRERTGRTVTLGFPDHGAAGIHLWPWMMQERQAVGRATTRPGEDGRRAARPFAPHVHVIVLVRPELTAEAMTMLDQVAEAIHENPVIQADDKSFGVSWESLDAATLAAVFAAASLRLSLCLSVVVAPVGSAAEARPGGAQPLGAPADLLPER